LRALTFNAEAISLPPWRFFIQRSLIAIQEDQGIDYLLRFVAAFARDGFEVFSFLFFQRDFASNH